jgi:hypothetical protein
LLGHAAVSWDKVFRLERDALGALAISVAVQAHTSLQRIGPTQPPQSRWAPRTRVAAGLALAKGGLNAFPLF